MRKRVDLHLHTTASDGSWTPTELVRAAKEAGLTAIAVTDHDTTAGVPEAMEAGESFGVEIVAGIEMTTLVGSREMHLLAYCVDIRSPALQEALRKIRDDRMIRNSLIVEKLQSLGVSVTLDEVITLAGGGTVGRPHIAQAIVRAGRAYDINSAFGKFLIPGTPAYVERVRLEPEEAIRAVRASGGVPVMAHPGKFGKDEMISRFAEMGLMGLEVYHTDHSDLASSRYLSLASKLGLIITGGSDSHGPLGGKPIPVGSVSMPYMTVEMLKEAAG
ncbi:MAG: PHP domain-containing protein [Armatimonadetes bacterium]|nr:PHP domain-containing protein [Armatimonadota bacterium]